MIINKEKDIYNILEWKFIFKLKIILLLVRIKKLFLLLKKWRFKWISNIENIKKYNIDKKRFIGENRKYWISWFARLKNGDDFLKQSLESIIDYLDELILIDNNSTDSTKKICLDFQKKYPNKVIFYDYEPIVYPLWSKEYEEVDENSVHNMSYYYNWSLSKTNYKIVIKIDDDHLFIDEEIKENIKNIKENKFNIIPWINLVKNEKEIFLPKNYAFAWLYWDYWFFKISPYTYFIKDKKCENFLHPYWFNFMNIAFFHLKYFKKDFWFINYSKEIKKYYISLIKNSLIKIKNHKYIKYLNKKLIW